jgi:hypothetical protein
VDWLDGSRTPRREILGSPWVMFLPKSSPYIGKYQPQPEKYGISRTAPIEKTDETTKYTNHTNHTKNEIPFLYFVYFVV